MYEGLEQMLRILSSHYPLFIVSNCEAGYIELFLECTGFSKYFRGHLCPGDTGNAKAENISQIVKLSNWMDIDLNLAYEEKPEKVHATLSKICEKISRVDGIEDCIYKGTQSFEESAVIYKLRLICPPENRPELHRAAMRLIQEELERADIRIPYRQLDIHSSPVP